MSALKHKLIRTIRTTLGHFAALVMVALGGVTVYYGTGTALSHLISSQQAFYQEAGFADYYFEVARAPAGVVKRIRGVPGVLAATGRVQKDVKILKNGSARDTGRLTGFVLLRRLIKAQHLQIGVMKERWVMKTAQLCSCLRHTHWP